MTDEVTPPASNPPVYANNLARKIAQIAASVKHVEKDGYNQHHKYAYASDSAIIGSVRDQMNALDVAIIPSVLPDSIVVKPVGDKGMILVTLVVQFKVIDGETGQYELANFPGAGSDYGDKGAYKAMTGAVKYFYQKLFNIPTGDDPDHDVAAPVGVSPMAQAQAWANKQAARPDNRAPASHYAPSAAPTASENAERKYSDDVAEAMPTAPAARSIEPGSSAPVAITKVETRNGDSGGKPWTLYVVFFSEKVKATDGRMIDSAATFDEKVLALRAIDAQAAGEAVYPVCEPSKRKGAYTLKSL